MMHGNTKLKFNVIKSGNWPVKKHELISKYLKLFLLFIKSINFDLCKGPRYC